MFKPSPNIRGGRELDLSGSGQGPMVPQINTQSRNFGLHKKRKKKKKISNNETTSSVSRTIFC
jgi:hypothetical protein